MADRHRNKSRISEANLALTPQSFRFPQETVDEITALAQATGLSKRQVVRRAIRTMAAAHGIEPASRNGSKPLSPDC
jgi:hypothetical protein